MTTKLSVAKLIDEARSTPPMTAQVTRRGALDMQVCVPTDWTDEQVKEFADMSNECGTENGWQIRRHGNKNLAGYDERVACHERSGHVHVMLDA